MRQLDDDFLNDLKEGTLSSLLAAVKSDHSLCLELGGQLEEPPYINVYYRGGSLMKVEKCSSGYSFDFDSGYFDDKNSVVPADETDVEAWIEAVPELKQGIDRHRGKRRKDEREFQQLLLRENNFGSIARSTDYYVCDMEYASSNGRFDLVAVHWPSKRGERKEARNRRLVFIEMKYGDGALEGPAGVKCHVEDVNAFLSRSDKVRRFKEDMTAIFNQKRELGILDCGKDLASFSDEQQPMLLLVFANHDPDKSKLGQVLSTLPDSPNAELSVATASFMGYGLCDQGIHTIDRMLERFQG